MLIRALTVSFTSIFLMASSVQAGGLYVPTFGSPVMGSAGAGAGALADDASTAIHNPAGMTRLDDHALVGGLAPGFSDIHFDVDQNPMGGGSGGQQGGLVPITSNQYVHKLSDRWRLGLSLVSISGTVLDPGDTWAGRNELTKLSLFTLSVTPTVGVRLTDWLSIGAGVLLTYGKLDLRLRLPVLGEPTLKVSGMDDFAPAAIASVLIEPTDNLRIGVLYNGKTDFQLTGKGHLLSQSAKLELDLPLAQAVRASLFWQAHERFALLASGGWEDWSVAKTLHLEAPGGSADIPAAFRDTWYISGGVHVKPCEGWMLQAGYRYDSSALKTADRTAALPIDRLLTLGLGTRYDYSENLRLGFSFSWTDLGKSKVSTANVVGDYDSNDLYLFGVTLSWKKLPWSGKFTL